jgi:hypothetical protein
MSARGPSGKGGAAADRRIGRVAPPGIRGLHTPVPFLLATGHLAPQAFRPAAPFSLRGGTR